MNNPISGPVSKALATLIGGLTVLLASSAGYGQPAWKPEKAVELVVGTAPGSGPDQTARIIQSILSARNLVPVPTAVITRPGGGGSVGWAYLNSHPGDGHFLMMGSANLSIAYLTGTSALSYKDLTPVALLSQDYIVLSVRADSPIRNGRDLLDRLRKDPTSLSLAASSVAGSTNHIGAALPLKSAGVDITKLRTVMFASTGRSITALLGGHVDVASGSLSVASRHALAGKTRIVGYTAPRRLEGEMANIPTWQEQGAAVEFSNYRAIVGPRGMTPAQVGYWENVFSEVDKDEQWRADVEKNYVVREFLRADATRKYLDGLEAPIKSILDELGLLKKK